MNSHPRYEILEPIAKGDYATVYRALDRELNREVAIKQIHQQYLDDPRQLERYWQEAQLLAKLEHPRIMTIYDIVRERGWLVLELMQGSLSQIQNGAAIDLNVLRMALTCGLHALHFLQQNGIIHGDVKPSNLLVDKNNRIKLGDFGIARRMAGDPGSVIKGTTKYMAPEVLSDQFGEVGPHSDLYSLGFAAYELMCGSHFDTLFPGLDMFGRDRQIAWMMWHSSPDRRLPEIKRVLQGVPDDLTYVIQKLIEKDPAKRYRTAEEVIHDMQALSQGGPPGAGAEEVAAAKSQAQKDKRKRMLTFAAFGVSAALCLAILFIPGEKPRDPNEVVKPRLQAGLLQEVKPGDNVFYVSPSDGAPAEGIPFSRELDSVLLNDRKVELADLEPGDQIKIRYLKSLDNRETKEISATRALAVVNTGTLAALDPDAGTVTLTAGEKGETFVIRVPHTAKLLLNEEAKTGPRTLELADLKAGDQVVVSHIADGNDRAAVSLHATRRVSYSAWVVAVDATAGKLVVRTGEGAAGTRKTLTVAKDCELSLNGATALNGKLISLADLQVDDRVQLEQVAQVTKIAAERVFVVAGTVRGPADAASFVVELEGREAPVKFSLAPAGRMELTATRTPVDLAYLRSGDKVKITHDSPDLKTPLASLVEVEALPDKRTWALIVVEQHYDDAKLAEIEYAASDGKRLRDALAGRYRVPAEQLFYVEDASRLKLEQDFDQFLKKVAPGSQLIVYYAGHAFLSPAGGAFLTPKEFEVARAETTGLSLKTLVARLEACPAAEKIFLLDACHSSAGKPAAGQPSSAELVESLRAKGGVKVSSTVTFVASCAKGECNAIVDRSGEKQGSFALAASEAFQGRADANRDLRVDANELFIFLTSRVGELSSAAGSAQAPARYLPDATPERITADGKNAIRKLLVHLNEARIDPRTVTDELLNARELAPRQPEVMLAYGLILLKLNRGGDALPQFETVKGDHPEISLAYQALAWHRFGQESLAAGVADLVQLIRSLPRPEMEGEWSPYAAQCLTFTGALRQFALKGAETPLKLTDLAELDEAIKSLDKAGLALCIKGMRGVDAKLEELDAKIATAEGAPKKLLESQRRRAATFATFDFTLAARYVREALEK